jgi:hypothetical protein
MENSWLKLTEIDIEHAYQALALDERRKAFRPTLWYIPNDLVDDPNTPIPELKQVWVCIMVPPSGRLR